MYEGEPQTVEKKRTVMLSRIIHRNQNGTCLGKGRSLKESEACTLPRITSNHDSSPGGQHYGTVF